MHYDTPSFTGRKLTFYRPEGKLLPHIAARPMTDDEIRQNPGHKKPPARYSEHVRAVMTVLCSATLSLLCNKDKLCRDVVEVNAVCAVGHGQVAAA